MTDKLTTNPVPRIRKILDEMKAAVKMSLEKAIELGGALAEQKAIMKHGEFGPWLETNFPDLTQRTANNYMKLHAHRSKLETVSNLSDAYKLLPKRTRAPKRTPDVVSEPDTPENGPEPVTKRHVDALPEPDETLPATDDIFREDLDGIQDYGEASGDPLADIREGLGVAPVNAGGLDEQWVGDVQRAAEALETPREGPEPAPGPKGQGAGQKADAEALPADWIIILTGVRATSVPEKNVTEALRTLLEKVRAKYPA